MTTALVVAGAAPPLVDLAGDLAAAGIHVLGAATRDSLVREASQRDPDLVVCHDASPGDELFAACSLLAEAAPRPVIVFTNDPEVAKIDRAMRSGIHAYVVNGYAPERLRGVLHVARARFQEEARLRGELAAMTRRFDERKLVDRAKGILMRARPLGEDEAFAVLRAASMHSRQRVGQVAQQVIAAAHYADAVNRAGRLGMLSQRLVKASALRVVAAACAAAAAAQLADTGAQIEVNIAALGKTLSRPTFGDLLDDVAAAWHPLRAQVDGGPELAELDRHADTLLGRAEQLTRLLETAGLVTTLHILDVSGRQRMLAQRYAKLALLRVTRRGGGTASGDRAANGQGAGGGQGAVGDQGAAGAESAADGDCGEQAAIAASFEAAMAHLRAAPLTTAEGRDLLADAERKWAELTRAAPTAATSAGARALDDASEALVAIFDELTGRCERSMHVLMG